MRQCSSPSSGECVGSLSSSSSLRIERGTASRKSRKCRAPITRPVTSAATVAEPPRSALAGDADLACAAARLRPVNADVGSGVDADLAGTVAALCHIDGVFVLRSGQTATTYFDKYLFEAEPAVLGAVAAGMAGLVPVGTEVLARLELGGVPVATALSLATGIPAAFVRKEAKEYGTARLAEGCAVAGRRGLVVEDVITTGGQVVASTEQLRALGATVEAVLCVIDRSGGDHSALESIDLKVISLFRAEDLP